MAAFGVNSQAQTENLSSTEFQSNIQVSASENTFSSFTYENAKSDGKTYDCIILVDWVIVPNDVSCSNSEVVEFSWIVYDINASSVLEGSRRLVKPTEIELKSIPSNVIKSLKLRDSEGFKYAKTLQQVLTEFDASCTTFACACVCGVVDSKRVRKEVLSETFRKSLPTPKSLRSVFDLTYLANHFYPQQFIGSESCVEKDSNKTSVFQFPRVIAAKLQAPVSVNSEDSPSMDGCIVMSQLIKKMHLDEIKFQSQHIITVVAIPFSYALKPTSGSGNAVSKSSILSSPGQFLIRMRGVPWGATEEDIIQFVEPICVITSADVHIATFLNGKASGEVYVRLPSSAERDRCLQELHGRHMGKRWIEVFKASENDIQHLTIIREAETLERRGALRLRGLPWSTNEYEIVRFFEDAGFQVNVNHVILGISPNNRFNGDAWVLLDSPAVAEEARRILHKKNIGKRYIEIFVSSVREAELARRGYSVQSGLTVPTTGRGGYERCTFLPISVNEKPSPYPPLPPTMFPYHQPPVLRPSIANPPNENCAAPNLSSSVLRLRGLPYHAQETHIAEFFPGFTILAIVQTPSVDGRPSGEAYVEFASPEEAWRALKTRNGALIDKRYIELFVSTKQEMELVTLGVNVKDKRVHFHAS